MAGHLVEGSRCRMIGARIAWGYSPACAGAPFKPRWMSGLQQVPRGRGKKSPVRFTAASQVTPICPRSGLEARYCLACSTRPGGIFCDLDEASLIELDRLRHTNVYPPGVVVYSEADQPRAAFFVCTGRVKLSRCSADGRAVVLGIAGSGDALGVRQLLLDEPYDHTAETIEETRFCYFRKDDFLGVLARSGDVSLKLARTLCGELGEAYRQLSSLALKSTAVRLAELLLELCQTHGHLSPEGITIKTNMCQDDLAELVGVSRRSLNRALENLRSQGYIECRRRFIIVRDHIGLRKCLHLKG